MAKDVELLSPCGSFAALEAALKAGADAIYLGGKNFNARMGAKNFEREDIIRAVKLCHEKGVRLFVALNTVIYDRAMDKAMEYAYFLYNAGVDALIVCDMGLVFCLRRALPDFELHASTQMAGNNLAAARFLCNEGFSRMVAARELSYKNLRTVCTESPIETEVFVHGALCASQSGGCLLSSVIGGRSGNRGECAQPCRLPYNGEYPLSLKDNCLAAHVKELIECGANSFKIEGRMKSPAYVYGVTAAYREFIDEKRNANEKEISSLASLFSRDGFTDGYFTGEMKNMRGVRNDANKRTAREASVGRGRDFNRKPIVINREKAEKTERFSVCAAKRKVRKMNTARFQNASQIPDIDFFDIIYLPLDNFCEKANGVILPPVVPDDEYQGVKEKIEQAKKRGAKHLLFCNIGQIELALESGLDLHCDFRFNVTNSYSAAFMEKYGDVMLNPELTLPQIRDIKGDKAVIVYGRLPVMTLENTTGKKVLCDRRGARFPVFREGGREIVYNSVPVYMADKGKELDAAGITNRHFIFSVESKKEVQAIVCAYKKSLPSKSAFTRIKAK